MNPLLSLFHNDLHIIEYHIRAEMKNVFINKIGIFLQLPFLFWRYIYREGVTVNGYTLLY